LSPLSLLLLPILAVPRAALAQHEEEVAPLLESFWSREVRVVQPRRVEKAGALELSGSVGVIPNDAFLVYIPLGLRLAYHLTERWSLELGFEYNLQADTGLRDYLEENDAQLRARIRDRQQVRACLSAGWSPVYGKLAVGSSVVTFDGYLLGGAGLVSTEGDEAIDLPAAVRPDLHLGAGLRLFFGRRWLVRLELRQYLYLRPEDRSGKGGGVAPATEVALGGGVLLGGKR
jgi:outer membrane beta-barrel protein